MNESLSNMTSEELWQLFPIQLVKHDEGWKKQYENEKRMLESILPNSVLLSHIGSTAIRGICAKPIVDILAEADACIFADIKKILLNNGYICMSESSTRISFNKGYTPKGFAKKVFHLHLREYGDNDELYFRDYMNENPALARQYEELKLSLLKPYEHDRDGYTDAKSNFVNKYTAEAKAFYGEKYNKK